MSQAMTALPVWREMRPCGAFGAGLGRQGDGVTAGIAVRVVGRRRRRRRGRAVAEVPVVLRRRGRTGGEGREDVLVRNERAVDDARIELEVEGERRARRRRAAGVAVADLHELHDGRARSVDADEKTDVVLTRRRKPVLDRMAALRIAAVLEVPRERVRRAGEVVLEGGRGEGDLLVLIAVAAQV